MNALPSLEDRRHVPGKEAPETMAMFIRFGDDLIMISCHVTFFFSIFYYYWFGELYFVLAAIELCLFMYLKQLCYYYM
jgi:hypothetical protein